ncbi:MAG: hypothetical protein M1812_006051 [Candelaria pacifica]|nr:MAG: hypothetical protein M1812_006051 [Candelaria pacifica]
MEPAPFSLPPLCDSYWVDPYDAAIVASHSRERVKEYAKQRQVVIAAELSDITADEYQEDIIDCMEEMEARTLPDVASIELQSEIQWFMRPYLLDFLTEAHGAFQLLPETLFLTINLLDRYCSKRVVYKKHYQLVGCAALLVAAKYGDNKNKVPTIIELKSMCCSLYEEAAFIDMEWHLLLTLDYVIGHPTVDGFLQLYLVDSPCNEPVVEQMALYISEVAMYHKEYIGILPSVIARSALYLAGLVLNRTPFPSQAHWTSTPYSHIIYSLSHKLTQPSAIVVRKYASNQCSAVSLLLDEFLARQASIAKTHAPPTPPRYPTINPPPVPAKNYVTPSKRRCVMGAPNGYDTPPETPVGGHGVLQGIKGNFSALPPTACPPTPSPLRTHRTIPQWQQYQGGAF